MSIMNDEPFCVECNTDKYIHYTYITDTYQCDLCWDDAMESVFSMDRQYGTPSRLS